MKQYMLSSISIERFHAKRYAWIYLRPRPPKKDDFGTAAEFAVLLRGLPGCGAVVSTGDGLDLRFSICGTEFRYAYDGIHGTAIECDAEDLERVKEFLIPFCTIELSADGE